MKIKPARELIIGRPRERTSFYRLRIRIFSRASIVHTKTTFSHSKKFQKNHEDVEKDFEVSHAKEFSKKNKKKNNMMPTIFYV